MGANTPESPLCHGSGSQSSIARTTDLRSAERIVRKVFHSNFGNIGEFKGS